MKTRIALCLLLLCASTSLHAQIHWDATLQNNHLWRGIEVADGMVLTTNVSVIDAKKHFQAGLWGGTNAQGTYKEFNYYASYTYKRFSLALWDTYNFSSGAAYNNREFFNYKARSTGRFLDATVTYRLEQRFPLLLSWSTVLFGRDRNRENTANKYSTFCYLEYPLYKKSDWVVDAGIGGAFALNKAGDASHFYGNTPGIVHFTVKVTRTLNLGNYALPVFACAVWNPQADQAYLQVGARLFSF